MSTLNVVNFLRLCAADQKVLKSCGSLGLPDLLFRAKLLGYSFTRNELAATIGKLEGYVIQQKDKQPINAASSLWRQMWGKTHLTYAVEDLVAPLSSREIENLAAPMIHQLIFARPKPGMSEAEFQRYWVEVHAVRYAAKIPQIRRYMVDTRVPLSSDVGDPLYSGIAEIWLANEEEQLASLQTKEFLEGARKDEPNWAAFWATLGLDTDAHTLLEGPPPTKHSSWVKYVVLWKRREGVPLEAFRQYSLLVHGQAALSLPGLRRHLQCHARDSLYAVGESRFDAVAMYWFDDVASLEESLHSSAAKKLEADQANFIEPRYRFAMAMNEHWIIGPDAR